jgi:hypothetical protein
MMSVAVKSSGIESSTSSRLATWMHERRATLKGVMIGSATWPPAFLIAWTVWPTTNVAPAERLSYVLQLAAAPAFVLFLMISSCMRLFDTVSAENPLLGGESERWKINQRVLSNTTEQLAVFALLLFAIATRLPASQVKLLPIAVTLWCAGRVMFWIGYRVAPHWRAPGFDWTFMTTTLLAGWFVYTLV